MLVVNTYAFLLYWWHNQQNKLHVQNIGTASQIAQKTGNKDRMKMVRGQAHCCLSVEISQLSLGHRSPSWATKIQPLSRGWSDDKEGEIMSWKNVSGTASPHCMTCCPLCAAQWWSVDSCQSLRWGEVWWRNIMNQKIRLFVCYQNKCKRPIQMSVSVTVSFNLKT